MRKILISLLLIPIVALAWPLGHVGSSFIPTGGGANPTFVAEYPTAFDSTTSPKTSMSAVSINSGDVLVGLFAKESTSGTPGVTEDGTESWILQQSIFDGSLTEVDGVTYTATTSEPLTVTYTNSVAIYFGANTLRFSNSSGVGASAGTTGSGSPSVGITTTADNSAIVVIVGDWNAVSGTQTFTSDGGAGTPVNLTDYPGDNAHYGVAIAYYPDAGTAGAKTVGMSAPTGQAYSIIAIEVKGP